MRRRQFIKAALATLLSPLPAAALYRPSGKVRIISTWKHGLAANLAAVAVLERNASPLDAVEAGVRVSEADPEVSSVGYGGLPDRQGRVTLDACIMDGQGQAGSVAFLENIIHPVSVARKVMEETDHVMLVGEGARQFALRNGFVEAELLTEKARKAWLEWKARGAVRDQGHDTISLLAQDGAGQIAGACTTSGLRFKVRGRVGDSPIIGAGLYVDGKVGAAGATGLGEEVIKTAGSFLVVEYMRRGYSPRRACEAALKRISRKHGSQPAFQVAYIALRGDGKAGAAALRDGFEYADYRVGSNTLKTVPGLTG